VHPVLRKFLSDLPAVWRITSRNAVLGCSSLLVCLSCVYAVLCFQSVHTKGLSARALDEQRGLKFPVAEFLDGAQGRLQAMNIVPVQDGGLALQWHLFQWPNPWFERFPLTVDQNLISARGGQLEENFYWSRVEQLQGKKNTSVSVCPQTNPMTPSPSRLWDSAISSPGQHLGEVIVSDSMVDLNHVDLRGTVTVAENLDLEPLRPDLHGTHVAGIMSALRNGEGVVGVIPGLQVRLFPLPLKLSKDGPRLQGQAVLNNLDSILVTLLATKSSPQRKPRVILLSWAFFESDGLNREFLDGLETRVRKLLENDVAVIVPAGNFENGRSKSKSHVYPASWASQLRDHRGTLLPVASLDFCSRQSWFANLASNDLGTVLLAPGERIFSTLPNNDYGYMSGSSAAAAQVAAVLAMTSAQFPDVEMKNQVHTLIRTSMPLANQGEDRLLSFDAPSLVQGLMAEFGWIAQH